MKKHKLTFEEIKELHQCDGYCYGGVKYDAKGNAEDVPMCQAIDTCEATRTGEGVVTLICILFFLLFNLAILGGGIYLVFKVVRWLIYIL